MKVDISIGKAVDKYIGLEIKLNNTTEEYKRSDIENELSTLKECLNYVDYEYYKLLYHINEQLWIYNNEMDRINPDEKTQNYEILNNNIFNLNKQKFRIRTFFNNFYKSPIKEHKSYNAKVVKLNCKCAADANSPNYWIYKKLPELKYLFTEYDTVYIDAEFEQVLKKTVTASNIIYINNDTVTEQLKTSLQNEIYLSDYLIPANVAALFEPPPIKYISGGVLSDFIYELSVIHEKFLETGRKGILYLSDSTDASLIKDILEIYNYLYNIIISQYYIKEFILFRGDHWPEYDIYLRVWNQSPYLLKESRYTIFKDTFHIEWGSTNWIQNIKTDESWLNKIIVNKDNYKEINNIDLVELNKKLGNNYTFVLMSINNTIFNVSIETNGIVFENYCPKSFYDMCVALKSCVFFIGDCASCVAAAHALHIPRIICNNDKEDLDLNKQLPNIYNKIDDVVKYVSVYEEKNKHLFAKQKLIKHIENANLLTGKINVDRKDVTDRISELLNDLNMCIKSLS